MDLIVLYSTNSMGSVSMTEKKHYIYLDILNIVACIAVVYLHCNGIVHSFSNTIAWKQALIIEVVCYFAVPIFLMITGANLLNYREKYDTKKFLQKRFFKVVIPYIVWSYIYYIIYRDTANPIGFVKEFLNGSIEPIFWFFPMIISLYLVIPIVSIFAKKEYKKEIIYMIIIIFLFQSILDPICKVLNISYPSVFSYMRSGLGYLIFPLLGYIFANNDFKKYSKSLYALTLVCWIIRYFYTYHYSIAGNIINKNLFNYLGFVSVIPAIAIFVFFKNINWNKLLNEKIKFAIQYFSACSFGVYLIHVLLKSKLTNLFSLDRYSITYRLIFPILLYLLCVLIVFVIKKLPIFKKIVP